MPTRKADWLAWGLQLIVGFVAGVLLGFVVIHPGRHSGRWVVNAAVVPHFITGAGLLVAAIASRYGDRLWMDYRVIPPDEPGQSRASVAMSVAIGLSGAGLIAFALLRHFRGV